MQDPARAATVDNLVLLTHAEADEHEQQQSLEGLRRRVSATSALLLAAMQYTGRPCRCCGRAGARLLLRPVCLHRFLSAQDGLGVTSSCSY
jgi:hypothetical protein